MKNRMIHGRRAAVPHRLEEEIDRLYPEVDLRVEVWKSLGGSSDYGSGGRRLGGSANTAPSGRNPDEPVFVVFQEDTDTLLGIWREVGDFEGGCRSDGTKLHGGDFVKLEKPSVVFDGMKRIDWF